MRDRPLKAGHDTTAALGCRLEGIDFGGDPAGSSTGGPLIHAHSPDVEPARGVMKSTFRVLELSGERSLAGTSLASETDDT